VGGRLVVVVDVLDGLVELVLDELELDVLDGWVVVTGGCVVDVVVVVSSGGIGVTSGSQPLCKML
jgi:hypothetical protein